MARLTTRYEGIWYTHRLLWQIVEQQAALARERDREWVNLSLVAVTFAFHALARRGRTSTSQANT
jgi:hypothetical protein